MPSGSRGGSGRSPPTFRFGKSSSKDFTARALFSSLLAFLSFPVTNLHSRTNVPFSLSSSQTSTHCSVPSLSSHSARRTSVLTPLGSFSSFSSLSSLSATRIFLSNGGDGALAAVPSSHAPPMSVLSSPRHLYVLPPPAGKNNQH